ncbi:5-oxoprolinase subunit PxpA [Rhizobium sp. SL86]|uniref:5-oxoprolinase subunit PxpA n=1 Tax=Rhizobium sp. SL86 TaxID=2995148 RepID=UPI00227535A2|nr:5-oxoprolinase subunit PxpA [Rhizobium sp. SL86]MCY1666718.1 5-oxoprolinase subunit PxpA [Rhizobium sp. SL86]
MVEAGGTSQYGTPVTLNCDMGESYGHWEFGDDAAIMPNIHLANIACGFHASDPWTMLKTVRLALSHGVKVGAHPSLPDKEGFGRREMKLQPEELTAAFIYQIGALTGMLIAEGDALSHVKPHGIVYGMAARNIETARAIARAVKPFEVPLLGMAGTPHETAAAEIGVPFIGEYFPDLSYAPDGSLIIPRMHSEIDLSAIEERMRRALKGEIVATDGSVLPVTFGTVCIHSDPPNARDVSALMRRIIDSHNG